MSAASSDDPKAPGSADRASLLRNELRCTPGVFPMVAVRLLGSQLQRPLATNTTRSGKR